MGMPGLMDQTYHQVEEGLSNRSYTTN